MTLADLKAETIEKILHEVADRQVVVTVRLPNGKEVVMEAKPHLQPLPELEGSVPEGWKDAVYAEAEEGQAPRRVLIDAGVFIGA